MKKILLSAYLCLSLLLAWAQEPGIRTSPFLAPSPAPCAQKGVLRTVKMQYVTVAFYCGVSAARQGLIIKFLAPALHAIPPDAMPEVHVIVFSDLDEGVAAEYSFLEGEGYHPSLQRLRSGWIESRFLGQTFKGAVFLYLGNPAWSRDPIAITSLTVFHEMHHLLQYQLLDANQHIPVWLLEGGADTFAALEMADLGLPTPPRSALSYSCDYPLADLEYEREDVPRACAYLEGAQAVRLLLDDYGTPAYYQLFRSIGKQRTFDGAFLQAYGFHAYDFYRFFDAYQESGQARLPHLPALSRLSAP